MIAMDVRLRLARKARLKKDPKTELSETAARIAELCTGERTVRGIIEAMRERFAEADRARVEGEVLAFLRSLIDRGLLIEEGADPS